jgi:hypothetical protein
MHLKDEQIARIAEKVLTDLTHAGLVVVKKERGALISGIREAIVSNLRAEEALERDAATLLEQTLRSMGGGAGIDRHKMLKMIKDKLAKDRKFVL